MEGLGTFYKEKMCNMSHGGFIFIVNPSYNFELSGQAVAE